MFSDKTSLPHSLRARLRSSTPGSLHPHVLWHPLSGNHLMRMHWDNSADVTHKPGYHTVDIKRLLKSSSTSHSSKSGRDRLQRHIWEGHLGKTNTCKTRLYLLTMCIFYWRHKESSALCVCTCVRQRDESQYVPTRHCENKSVRMKHVTHHSVWMWRSEAMCGQRSLLHGWLKSNLTYANTYIHADTHILWAADTRLRTGTYTTHKEIPTL